MCGLVHSRSTRVVPSSSRPLPRCARTGSAGAATWWPGTTTHVKMFNYPVVWDDAPCRVFKGHSSHVTCTRFSCDDRHVLSVGDRDRAVFQWRTIGVCQEDEAQDRPLVSQGGEGERGPGIKEHGRQRWCHCQLHQRP